jgi:hypothetical protein
VNDETRNQNDDLTSDLGVAETLLRLNPVFANIPFGDGER